MNFQSLLGEDLLLDLQRKYRKLVPHSSKYIVYIYVLIKYLFWNSYSAGISTSRQIDFVVASIVAFVKANFFARLKYFLKKYGIDSVNQT